MLSFHFLSVGEFWAYSRRLASLVLPILITQFCQASLGMVDAVMSGRVSALDLAAVSIGSGVWLPLFLLATGILIATTPLVGAAAGQGRDDQVRHITQQSLWTALAIGLIGFFLMNFSSYVLVWMRVPEHILPKANDYLYFVAFGFPALSVYAVLRSYCEALGRPQTVTAISILGLLVNIPLNYVFIYGKFGMPALGGAGCGLATACVLWVNVCLLLGYLFVSKRPEFTKTRFFYPFSLPNQADIVRLLKLGIPIGVSLFFEVSLFSLAALVISPLGDLAVAAHQVALAVTSQLFTIPMSIAMALTIMVANRFGEKNLIALIHVQQTGLIWATGVAMISMIGVWLFRSQLADAFTDNLQVQKLAMHLLLFAIAYQLFDAWQVNIAGILRGMQDTTVTMWITLFCYWLVALPLGTFLVRFTSVGAEGFWIALVTGLFLASLLLSWRLWLKNRQLLAENRMQ